MTQLTTPELVAAIRTRARISQEELARRMGVSFASVNAWERGRTTPRVGHRAHLDELAAELGIRQGLDVVVIDDEPDVCELAEVMLHALEPSARVATATSGTDGLLACGANQPDLVLLDLLMPGLDGLEVALAMGRVPGLADTVLVFVTGTIDGELRQQAESVAARVVTRPLRREVLGELIALVDDPATPRVGALDERTAASVEASAAR